MADEIAIIGLAGRFPGARDLDGFWRLVREGGEALVEFSDADLEAAGVAPALRDHPDYVRRGTVLEDADHFDAGFFGFSPREAQILDPQHRLFLECAWEALEHAGYAGALAGQAVGVYAGASLGTYLVNQLMANPAFVASAGGYQIMVGNDKDFLATRISYRLDLRGPSVTVQTACSTSLVAVQMACRALQHGECDVALAGGVAVAFPQRAGYLFQEGMILSPDGRCRPFDAEARGTRGGAGAGIVVLKRLADAAADRDTVHAVILGAAINNDGAGKAGYTAPSVEGQIEVIATAQALAGVAPRSIGYLEAHGTGTPLGDPIEIAALTQVFRAGTADTGFCRLGSLKANIGHLDAAAGVASLIKTVLALGHRELPPLVGYRAPNPQLGLERSPFVASAAGAPWPTGDTPRRAGVSSFGIGGTNAHVVLEEAPRAAPSRWRREPQLLVLSARTPEGLDRATADLGAHLAAASDVALADAAWTLQIGRQTFPHRRALVVRDRAHALEALAHPQRPPVIDGHHEGGPRPVAFLFSGQGSQHAGMGAGLYATEPAFRAAVDRCVEILEPALGLDPRAAMFEPAGEAIINETRLAQPLLFTIEYALACLWKQWGITPAAMLGHSIGEYVAAHLAGVMSLEDALALVAARGRLMQAQAPGSMAAVHLPAEELEPRLAAGVEIAAVNAPGLSAISGPAEAVAALLAELQAGGVECRPLHTSHAFHSAMMEPALEPFTRLLEGMTLSPPRIPYVSNLTGTWIRPEEATSPAYYARHLRRTVRFEAGVRALAADPAQLLLEVGPGNALASLARLTLGPGPGAGAGPGAGKENARRAFASLGHARERRPDGEAALEAAGRLWLAGAPVDWKGLHAGEELRRVPLPTYPFERSRYWVDRAPAPTQGRRIAAVEDWLYAPTWTRDDTPATGRLAGTWLVLAPPGPLGEAVRRQLADAGASAVLVERPGDLAAIAQQIPGGPAGGLLVLGLDAPNVDTAYHGAVALAASLAPARGRLLVATAGAESVLGEPVRHPEAALALGPVLVLPTEVPGLRARLVDLDASADDFVAAAARDLAAEAALADGENVVARRAGRRWVRRFERIPQPPPEPAALPLKRGGVYLVTGGLGGIGLTLARWLAAQVGARLLLTARTPLPPRATWAAATDARTAEAARAIAEIEQAGGEVLVAAADAADEAATRRAVDEARARWGAIDGVIHAAGVPGTGSIAFRKQPAEVQAVLAPKLGGLEVLVRVLGETPLDFVALFSSINAVVGAPGVCDYSGANAVLAAFPDAAACPRAWRRVVAFDWGPWREVGMAAKLVVPEAQRKEREALLRSAIAPAAGADAFARGLASGRRRIIVAPFDLPHEAEQLRDRSQGRAAEPAAAPLPTPAHKRPELTSAYAAPGSDTERKLAAIWSELLGLDRIGVHDDFFQVGGHSLLATRVLARIRDAFGTSLDLRDVFDAPTIHRLAERVNAAAASTPPGPASSPDREDLFF